MSKIMYTKDHEWIDLETGRIGISDHAQHELGDLVFINLPSEGDELHYGESFCDVESVKAVSDINAPADGTIVEVNTDLEAAPETINSDAMGAWICRIEIKKVPDDLMDEAAYAEYIK